MPMSIPGMASDIMAALIAQFGPAADALELQKFCTAIATAVVTHIQTNATVIGVTPGPGTATIT